MASLAVCTASGRDPKWPYAYSLARLTECLHTFLDRATVQIHLGYATDQARNCLVSTVKQEGFSHLLFIDDDMSFPADTAERLLKHDKDIVAANYPCRTFPVLPLAQRGPERVFSRGKTGLEQVDEAPTGIMMIRTAIFDKLPMPWFQTTFQPNDPFSFMSDDVWFCKLAKKHGYEVWIDHDLSQSIGHIGEFQFHHDLTLPPPVPRGSVLDQLKSIQAGRWEQIPS